MILSSYNKVCREFFVSPHTQSAYWLAYTHEAPRLAVWFSNDLIPGGYNTMLPHIMGITKPVN